MRCCRRHGSRSVSVEPSAVYATGIEFEIGKLARGAEVAERRQGTVQEYHPEKAFGLIKVDGTIRRILVRKEALDEAGYSQLRAGERLAFDIAYDERFIPHAVHLRRVAPPEIEQFRKGTNGLPRSA